MGHEVVYCCKCSIRLLHDDFVSGRAIRLLDRAVCAECAREIKDHPPDTKTLPRQKPPTTSLPVPVKPSTTRLPVPGKASTRRIPVPSSTRRIPLATPPSRKGLWIGLVLAAIAVAGLALFLLQGPSTGVEQAGPEVVAPKPVKPDPGPSPEEEARLRAAREALEKARQYQKDHPDDIQGQVEAYAEAHRQAAGTPLAREASEAQTVLLQKLEEQIPAELAALKEKVKEAAGREEFKAALDLLQEARPRYTSPRWQEEINRETREIRLGVEALYAPLKGKAVEARKRAAVDEDKAIRDRVARWGLEDLTADLEAHLKANAPPLPSPALLAYRAEWEKAMERLISRDFDGAAAEMERAGRSADDPDVRKESAADAEAVRLVKELYGNALRRLAGLSKGDLVDVEYAADPEKTARASGYVVEAWPERVELESEGAAEGEGKKNQFVEYADIRVKSLAVFLAEVNPPPDPRALALLCLFEGDGETARAHADPASDTIPGKYWTWAQTAREKAPRPPAAEYEARDLFHEASREWRSMKTRGLAIEKYKSLQGAFIGTSFVSRNMKVISLRSEAGKEYVYQPPQLKPSGQFRLVKREPMRAAWASTKDLDFAASRDNFLRIEFYALPELSYRCWVYAGGCCSETFTFYYQATEATAPNPKDRNNPFPLEPGGNYSMDVPLRIRNLKRTHASHGGPKQPSRWEWVEIPLPERYAAPGPKEIRLLSNQAGFSVGFAVVSSLRKEPPDDKETQALMQKLAEMDLAVGLLVTDFKVRSGKPYQWYKLGNGKKPFIDRPYPFLSVPESLEGAMALRTANDDKTVKGDGFITFGIGESAVVYVAYDERPQLPGWLKDFKDTGMRLKIMEKPPQTREFRIFSRPFPAGKVSLGGADAGKSSNMYIVILAAAETEK